MNSSQSAFITNKFTGDKVKIKVFFNILMFDAMSTLS